MPKIELIAGEAQKLSSLPHILLVVDGFPKTLGGGERIVLKIASLLPNYGFQASILALAIHPESEFFQQTAPCPVYLLPLTSAYNVRAAQGALALSGFLKRNRICLVQTFFESSDIWAGCVTKLLSRAKLIWSRRDMGILRTSKHALAYRWLRWLPDAVVAVSTRVAEHVLQTDGVHASRVHVVHNGLDLHAQAPALITAGVERRRVVTIGNVRRVKGHDLLVQAAFEVVQQHPEVSFFIAGDVLEEEYFRELRTQVEAYGLQERFHFLGRLADFTELLRPDALFVLPSRSEGFSNALIEAMAAGVPVIATNVGGNGEAVLHEQNGLLIAPENAAALTQALLKLLNDRKLADDLSSAALQTVRERFTSEAMMQRLTQVYRACL